jgi:hypothetical protein
MEYQEGTTDMPTPLWRVLSLDRKGLCQAMLAGAMVMAVAMPARAQEVDAQQVSTQQAGDDGAQVQGEQGDPPLQVARISVAVGNVSVEPASVDQFSQAEVNYPLTTGDRMYTDTGASAELETDQLAVRLGQQTDLTMTAMTDSLAQFGQALGSVHLRSYSVDAGATVELDTPNVAVTVVQPGDVRVDVDPDGNTTVAVESGQVQVDGNGLQQVLDAGQRVRLSGSDQVAVQWLYAATADGLDSFAGDRDAVYESSVASEAQNVNPETIGAADLSANGAWETDTDDGAVWYPGGVGVGWAPYSCGGWAWVAPWGWTWVECEAWGFAPFHYGRWVHRGERWGWIPGPGGVRPVYSPAMVVFVGGTGLAGVTAWFPLGPHEVYAPWYEASPLYLNRVNVANLYSTNAAEVRSIYDQRTEASEYAAAAAGERGYVNRAVGTVAVSQASFAAGKPVARSQVHVSSQTLAGAAVLPHPMVTPQRTLVVAAAAKAVPARVQRPALASRADEEGSAAAADAATSTTYQNGMAAGARQAAGAVQRESPAAPAQTQRPLFHQAVPPEPRPSFDEQQKAIDTIDPGRPLGPQQMDNLRQNKPAGPPEQREAAHPAAARKAPAPRSAPPAAATSAKPH